MAKEEHILVCLSSAPSNARIIRTAAKMADAYSAKFSAVYIYTPDYEALSTEDKNRLLAHFALAKQLGASVETIHGEDVAFQIAEFARLSAVTMVVLGRSALTRKHLLGKTTLTEQLTKYVPEMDIHIIPDNTIRSPYHPKKVRRIRKKDVIENSLKSVLILLACTLLSLLFYHIGFTDSNIIMVYILGVLVTSVVTSHQLYSLVSAISSVLIFNYVFTIPRFSFAAYETGYPVTFLVMFLTAYVTGSLALRYKDQAKESTRSAVRTKTLFDTDQLLSKATEKEEILEIMGTQLTKLLRRNILIYACDEKHDLSVPKWYLCENEKVPDFEPESEREIVRWVVEHNHSAGAGTEHFSSAKCYYLTLRVSDHIYGVVGIEQGENPLEAAENGMVIAILGEAALVMENYKNAQEKEEAALMAEREQLRANLLRTISHDLRTPLTSISGNASNLMKNGELFDEETKQQICKDIYDDSMWLINLVENLLYATRIEDGRMVLSIEPEMVTEIIGEALQHISRQHTDYSIVTDCKDDFLMVRVDARLVVQVIINLVDNAIKYSPKGTEITVKAVAKGAFAEISVTDNGIGIPEAEKEKIFEMFYTGSNRIADNRRSLGLGLYLCKSIIEAHGGTISVLDHVPHGSEFRFTLPIEEVKLYE